MLIPSQRYTFAVYRVWKGPTDSRIKILEGSSNCSVWFETGKKYLVFASRHETEIGSLDAHKCGGPTSESATAARRIAELGPPIAELSLSPPVRRSQVYRATQHASVYFWTGVAVLKFGLEHPFRSGWRICLVLVVTLAATIGLPYFIHRRLRRRLAKAVVLGVTVLALCAIATIATGYFYVYRNYGWANHLLEGWSW
jgi:hypothetical protein